MNSAFQLVNNTAVVTDLAAKGAAGLTDSVVNVVQKSRDTKDLRSAGEVTVVEYIQPPASLSRYIYDVIPTPTSIRILQLAPGQANDPITCQPCTVNLDDCPEYTALSYCWGGPLEERKIICGEGTLNVTRNLYEALHRFRDPEKPFTLWADAICINQEDLAERAQQVPLMGRIYKDCKQCIVWLGLDEQIDYAASQLLAKLSQLKSSKKSKGKPWSRLNTTPHQWEALRKLLDRPWFIRMWTLQEIVLPHKAIIMCGKYEWQVEEFFSLVNFIHDNQGEEELGGVSFGLQQCLKVAARRELEFPSSGSSKDVSDTSIGLLEILRDARERDAGDLRDKVFAVLGLCKEEDFSGLVPNYEESLVDVYIDVARLILKKTPKPLHLLFAAGIGQQSVQDTPVPSWVPDWSYRTVLTVQMRSFEECGKFSAGGNSSPELHYLKSINGTSYLQLKGKVIGRLNNFIDINDPQFKSDWELKNYPKKSKKDKFVDIYAVVVFGSSAADNEPRSLLQWFVMKCSEGYGKEGEKETPEFDGFWKTMSRELETDDDLEKKLRKKFKDYAFPPPHSKEDGGKSLAPFLHDLGVWTQSRKFYRGRIIGWVPLEAKFGDFVCVLKGSELPYILRETEGGKGFQLIGHCYMQGIMHGEVAAGAEWENINLR